MILLARHHRWLVAALLSCAAGCGGNSPARTDADGGDAAADAPTLEEGDTGGDQATGGGDGISSHLATMFLPNSLSNFVYRYAIAPTGDPMLSGMVAADRAAGAALTAGGDLLVSDYSAMDRLYRITEPLGALTAADPLSGFGLNFPQEMRFVDDELWVMNTADHACTTEPQSIVRLAFDADGNPSAAGTVQTGLIGANRGMLWVPATRDLFVSQCTPVNTIQHLRVAADHSVTALPAITGHDLANPHGMAMTDWGELLVANFDSQTILRFSVDDTGVATAAGNITGNGLSSPVGMALTAWGELFVVNQGDGSVSRFTFADDHGAVPSGNFSTHTPSVASQFGVGWILIVPTTAP